MIVWNINCKGHNLFQGNADNLLTMCPPNPTDMLLIRNLIILMTLKLISSQCSSLLFTTYLLFFGGCVFQ